ncbi:MAG TPA: hypothetical protein PLV21_06680 [Cyclobacteriaceae bacterium]|nr:hypothetical protein [Cyclobacteriaceae bacterium]HRJ81548.1 hypothetical protein [Cyclobacteriaceae bacterium]
MMRIICFRFVPDFKVFFLAFLLAMPASGGWAQQRAVSNVTVAEIEAATKGLEMERDAIFMQALQLSLSEALVFQTIYSQYSKERKVLDEELLGLIVTYLEQYPLPDKKFTLEFVKHSEKYQRKELKLRKKYFQKLSRNVSVQTASRFYELDDFCATVLRLNILLSLPFSEGILQN